MAGELAVSRTTGQTVYAVIIASGGAQGGKFWNGTTFETRTAGNWTSYDVALTELTGAGLYFADMPALPAQTLGIRLLDVFYYQQAGGSPAVSDTKIAATRFELAGDGWQTKQALAT